MVLLLKQRAIIALAVLSFIACLSSSHAFSQAPQLGVGISAFQLCRPPAHGMHNFKCVNSSPRMTLRQETNEWQLPNFAQLGKLSVVLAAVILGAPQLTDAASPDLSHSPLAKSTVKVVVEGRPRVVDGDTLVFEDRSGQKERVRMLGIDAPESKQVCINKGGKEYQCGVEAKAYLETIIGSDPVQCLAAKRDQYSRILGVCFDQKTGTDLNEAMVNNGEAVAYVQFSKAYVGGEAEAMKRHQGLWQGEFQKPWDYRKMKRSKAAQNAVQKKDSEKEKSNLATGYVISDNRKIKMAKTEFEMPDDSGFLDDAE